MARSTMRALKTALERGTFDRVYLFHGDDDYLKDEKVRALIARATDAGTRDFNLEVRRGGETDATALSLALDGLPMMADHRVVVIRDVTALKKDALAALHAYLAKPASETILVLTAIAGAKVDGALLELATSVEFKTLAGDDLVRWTTEQARGLGAEISEEVASLLLVATGSDLALIAGELDKLRTYTAGAPIDASAVEAVVGVRHGETMGDILDLVATREVTRALPLIGPVLLTPKTSGVTIVMAMTAQLLATGWGLAARARGLSQQRLESEFYTLLKEGAPFTGRSWGDTVKCYVRSVRHWDIAAVDRALANLVAADRALKETKVSSEEQILASLLLGMADGARRRAVA
jgi:DNA polymerase-3 subunit delta